MFNTLLRTKERRMVAIYILTSFVLYGGFWLSYYFMPWQAALWTAAGIGALGLSGLLIRFSKKDKAAKTVGNFKNGDTDTNPDDEDDDTDDESGSSSETKLGGVAPDKTFTGFARRIPRLPFIPLVTIILFSFAIGMSMSAFFIYSAIVPSRFFGLVLLVMLGYKIGQLLLGELIKDRWKRELLFKIFIGLCTFAEVVGAVVVFAFAWNKSDILFQVFFTLVLCVFYSFGQIHIRRKNKKRFWDEAASSYLMGFLSIFVLVLVLIAIAGGGDISGDVPFEIGEGKKKNGKTPKKPPNVVKL